MFSVNLPCSPLSANATVTKKTEAWSMEDDATEALQSARAMELDAELELRRALGWAEIGPVIRLLSQRYRARVVEAEDAGANALAAEYVKRLRDLGRPEDVDFIEGGGQVSLLTDPPARVRLMTYVGRRRRELEQMELLGTTPLDRVGCPRGSHQLVLQAPGCPPVSLPIEVARGQHVQWSPPDEGAMTLRLPREAEIGPTECWVPGGWFRVGGDRLAVDALSPRRIWVDGFFIQRDPLTYATLMRCLNTLLDEGRDDLARAICPAPVPIHRRTAASVAGLEIDGDGRYVFRANHPEAIHWPVNHITWQAARLYAAHHAAVTGQPWRLPHGLEREKAARGVDGRPLPWGTYFDPTWSRNLNAIDEEPTRSRVGEPTTDESPYGVRGMAGNVRDWCLNPFTIGGPVGDRLIIDPAVADTPATFREVRGGAWGATPELCRSAARFGAREDEHYAFVGVRLVRSEHG